MEAQGMKERGEKVMQTRKERRKDRRMKEGREGGTEGERDRERTSRQNPIYPKPKPKVQPGSCAGKGNGELLSSTQRKSSGCQRDRLPRH